LIGRQVARPDGVGITAPGRSRRSQTDILEDEIL
jgi:hypothetical protein